jgi:hypothetical protein
LKNAQLILARAAETHADAFPMKTHPTTRNSFLLTKIQEIQELGIIHIEQLTQQGITLKKRAELGGLITGCRMDRECTL